MLAVIDEALGSGRAVTKKSSKVVPDDRWLCTAASSNRSATA
jgi:hypothetical protein